MVEGPSAEAILFFDNTDIIKQVNYAEFQAILDNYVPMNDIASRSMRAVYVRVNPSLFVTACVFFKISFDSQGFVVRDWNIPLQQLADNAAQGPNLGAGTIKLACRSQSSINWLASQLWDPCVEASSNDFQTIKKVIKNNSLGFIFKAKREVNVSNKANNSLQENLDDEHVKAAMLIKEQRLRLRHKLLTAKNEQDIRKIRLDHHEQILQYQQRIKFYQKDINELNTRNVELQEQLTSQTEKIAGMREYFESKLANAQRSEVSELAALREYYESELATQVENAVSEQKNLLQAKDVELLYRSEREERLQEELLELQKENQRLLASSGEVILDQLTEAGVDFVIYHPGAGHLTIQPAEISTYLDNPLAFVANHCGVNEHLYQTWLDHFYRPVCMHEDKNGEPCNQPIPRLDDPSQFVMGESDRCEEHRDNAAFVININKNCLQKTYF